MLRHGIPEMVEVKKSGRLIPVASMESGISLCAPTL
jgi:hypothetical protein